MTEPLQRELPCSRVSPSNTALLVIDMENDFVGAGAVQETPGGLGIVPRINRLIAWSRAHELPVIFTQEMHRSDGSDYGIELEFDPVHCLEGTPGCAIFAGLDARPEDPRIVAKRRDDCFLGMDLDLLLRCRRIENLVCCGVSTNVCVMSTVFTARNLDYRVLLPTDATAAISPVHYDAAILCMSDVFAYLMTIDELENLWK